VQDCLDSDLGIGFFHAKGPGTELFMGGREEAEFTLYPKGITAHVGKEVFVDTSRRLATRVYVISGGRVTELENESRDFPDAGWNRFEIATDDTDSPPNPIDEDDTPTNDHVYEIDWPGLGTTANEDFLVMRSSYQDFVRFKFGPDAAGNPQTFKLPNLSVDGSRGSRLEPWHMVQYMKRARLELGTDTSYAQDLANPSTSFCRPGASNAGNGTCDATADPTNGVTEGWAVTYDNNNNRWDVAGTDGSFGRLTNQPNGTWSGTASKGGNDRITITVTAGATAFANGDYLKFSTFKTADTKKNEILTY